MVRRRIKGPHKGRHDVYTRGHDVYTRGHDVYTRSGSDVTKPRDKRGENWKAGLKDRINNGPANPNRDSSIQHGSSGGHGGYER